MSAAAVLLSGCVTGGSACDGWRAIRPTKADVAKVSDWLAEQLLAHNAYGERIGCWKR